MSKKKDKKLSKSQVDSLKSGLVVGNSIKISYNRGDSVVNKVLLLVITAFGLFGTVFSFTTLFSMDISNSSLILWTLIFFGIFSVICLLPDRFLVAVFPIVLVYLYIFKDYLQEFILGFKVVANYVAVSIHDAGVWSKYYQISSGTAESEYATIFLIFCSFVLTCLICLFTIKVHSCVMGFVLTFPFIECGIYFGAVPNYVPFFMVICYWIAILSMAFSGCKKSTKNKSASFVRVGNSFFAKSDCNFRVSEKIGVASILACVLCAVISSSLVYASGYERSQNIDDMRNNVKDSVENFSTDSALSNLSNLFKSGNSGDFTGNLGEKDGVQFKMVDKLNLTTSQKPVGSIYLKSFVGATYTGNSWDELSKKDYNNEIFDEFESNSLYPQDLPFVQFSAIYDSYQLTIEPVDSSSKISLVPYASQPNGDYSYVYDKNFKLKDLDSMSFTVVNVPFKSIFKNDYSADTVEGFNSEAYNQFVEEYYLQLPSDETTQAIEEVFQSYLDTYGLNLETLKSISDLNTKLEWIRDFLCSDYEYTLSPGSTPVGEDFVLYFLRNSKKGYCAHYASAGTVLCRIMGIPARYVEGYFIDSTEFSEDTFDGTNYNVAVKDSFAHAWAEIYVDNVGWIDYEFTLGFDGNEPKETDSQEDEIDDPNLNVPETQPMDDNVSQPVESQVAPVTDTPSDVTESPEGSQENANNNEITTPTTEEEVSKPLLSAETIRTIRHILFALLVLAVVVGLVILRRKYILAKRMESISSEDGKISVLASYRYAIQLLKYLGFTRGDTTPYMSFAKDVSTNCKYAEDFQQVMELTLKAELSNLEVSEEEKLLASNFANTLASQVYEEKSKVDRLVMKYLLCLV